MRHLQAQYAKLGAQPGFAALRQRIPVLATWDDHDYGTNDCGRNHPEREQSKVVFLDFFQEPANSLRRTRPGIYTSYVVGPVGRRVQFIVLDERTFRTEPVQGRQPETDSTGNYEPQPTGEMLGPAQWQWLEEQLRQPAEVRIVCSSTQFVSEFSGYELWALYPREKERMLNLIRQTRANGVLFISGDVHVGEVSRLQPPGLYPLWDVTSSGLTEVWRAAPPNRHRVGPAVLARNFGLISINWNAPSPVLTLELWAEDGAPLVTHSLTLSELQPAPAGADE
jgi:alkaline phosphatase D